MKSVFLPFVFLSATAHYAVLNQSSQWPLELNETGEQGRSGFAIEIIHTKTADKPTGNTADTSIIKPTDKLLTRQAENEVRPIKQTTSEPALEKLKQTEKPAKKEVKLSAHVDTIDEPSDKNTAIESTIRKLLTEELDKYFYYPKAAVRRNWQGSLTVSFVIHQDGSIDNIRISESSGYSILDNAAISSVSQFQLTANRNLLSLVDSTETSLPVRYILN